MKTKIKINTEFLFKVNAEMNDIITSMTEDHHILPVVIWSELGAINEKLTFERYLNQKMNILKDINQNMNILIHDEYLNYLNINWNILIKA
ncbi:hypothetical protein [Pedobacter gandavensis]|uniref:hypothetical protein n=1 Tax=Pedobacter gandavensis TaxID=2679963 RepID=UPI0029303B9C|nr:hypothetical protein [Pedobacter gandavensis]